MPECVYTLDTENLFLDRKSAAEIGKRFSEEYQSGEPYHHICIDNFLPEEVARKVHEEAMEQRRQDPQHESAQEHLKASYNPNKLPLYSRAVFAALNSDAFLKFLEEMTGIKNLIPDPYFLGAGIHRTETGGYLGIHADFNHHQHMHLERRLNILIYLNPDWKPDYGGAFEVWTKDMKTQVAQFPPLWNRMCCFSTSSESYHGNPEPVNHPDGLPRLSIALYYYTPTWDDTKTAHSTLFRPRPGSGDKPSNQEHRHRVLKQVLPPVIYRRINRRLRRMGI